MNEPRRGISGGPYEIVYISFEVPIRVRSEMNERTHYMTRGSRFKRQRKDVGLAFRAAAGPPPHACPLPAKVTITRLAPQRITDGDNLQAGCKAVRDQIAACCGWNDGDTRITWDYQQEHAKEYGVRITIETKGTP